MRFCILLIAICTIIPSAVFSQQRWERNYGGTGCDEGYSVQQTSDGGYIVAGGFNLWGDNAQVYLIKTEASGDTLWTRTYGGARDDWGRSVQQTSDGGYIIAGSTNSFGDSTQVYLIKTDASGDTLWTRTYGGVLEDQGNSVDQTTDGGYIIAGWSNSFGNSAQVYLIKTEASGDTLWTRAYGEARDDAGQSVQQTLDGGYIIAGTSFPDSGLRHMYLAKTDAFGDTLWSRCFGVEYENNYGQSVQQTTDGGYIVAGSLGGLVVSVVYLVRTDSHGDTLWSCAAIESGGNCVQQTSDGGYIVTGTFWGRQSNVILARTDATGNYLWGRSWGNRYDDDGGYSVQQTTDGGYIIAGATNSYGNGGQVYLIKTDSLGYSTDVEEENNTALKTSMGTTIICGHLQLPPGKTCRVFDITGQKVMDLHSVANNIHHLAPGVYFIRKNNNNQVIKIIVTR